MTHTERSIRIHQLNKSYRPGVAVLHNIDLTLQGVGVTAIIGPSGAGKSTLMRCINRLVEPTKGEIWFRGRDLVTLRGAALREARRSIGMVFQEHNLVERLTVMENVLCGRLGYLPVSKVLLRQFPRADIDEAQALLESIGLADLANERADQLSGGQRQRVGIGRAIMQHPEVLLADEPTSSLDPKTSVEIMELVSALAGRRNIPVIVNMHNVDLAKRFCTRMIGLSAGALVFDGNPAELTDDRLKEIYGGEDWLQ